MQPPMPSSVVSVDPHDRMTWVALNLLRALEETSFLARFHESVVLPTIAFRLDRPPKA